MTKIVVPIDPYIKKRL